MSTVSHRFGDGEWVNPFRAMPIGTPWWRIVIVIVLVCGPAIYAERWSPSLRILLLMLSGTAVAVTLMWVHATLS